VNEYLRDIAPDVTAKDFRTWAGTVLAFRALRALDAPATDAEGRRNVMGAMRATADALGNTAAVCRQAYVHPIVVEAYLDGRLGGALIRAAEDTDESPAGTSPSEERAVADLLRQRLRDDAARVKKAG
jgi:DNA topoisomerase-1